LTDSAHYHIVTSVLSFALHTVFWVIKRKKENK